MMYMSLAENLKESTQYLKPFAKLIGAFFGLVILGFLASYVLNYSLYTIMLVVVLIAFIGILALSFKVFA